MLAYKPNIVPSNMEYKIVGKQPIRHNGADKVTGRALEALRAHGGVKQNGYA